MHNFKTFITDCVKATVIIKDSGTNGKRVVDIPSHYDEEMSFVMYKSQNGEGANVEIEENQANQEEQLQQLVAQRIEEIKSVAQKVVRNGKTVESYLVLAGDMFQLTE
ncbi:hypothetical protein Ancab_039081, partial [Ancistrocladus abbreviatus]